MTDRPIDSVIPAVVPSGGFKIRGDSRAAMKRPPLPLARLAPTRDSSAVYGLATLDVHGRVADRAVMTALGWGPGLRLGIRESGGLIIVGADRQGVFRVTREGHVRLPAVVRQWCGLTAGDRVLLAADPAAGRLVLHPPASLDAVVARVHAEALGGDEA
ncbi:AbrB/MazE/SpoVT family DNA-binding domain-containing protein [Micromonospora sp. L5]|uniref:AbrB/MazE/SpoVT family DNA-binding domain-containing protein n=1 Tax=Micromonospora sp. (strain L5) TaxID=648999 RepID=UPI001F48965D|nr:AbrB/MazE/SpoVT family DNA-binding domain-containing protein [Micromonospora sp. L5]